MPNSIRIFLKGTVCVSLSEPPCKHSNLKIKTVPLKTLSNQI